MRALVTGGTGFIGSNLSLALLSQGYELVITGHDAEQSLPGFQGKCLQPTFLGLDWNAIGKVDIVFHQAAINNTLLKDREEMILANVDSSEKLFEEMIHRGCRRFVYASSTAVYGNLPAPYREDSPLSPLNPYGESKKLLEERVSKLQSQHRDAIFVGLRYCNVYGPRESHKGKRASMVYQLAQQMQKGDPQIFEFGEQKRDYIYVKDVVHANLLAARSKESCIVNCGSGASTTFNNLIFVLNNVLNLKRTPIYIKNPYQASYQNHTECDMTLTKAKLGFTPEHDITSGIVDYFRSGYLV